MLVADVMHRGLITCPPGARLGEIATLLRGHGVHALVVADPSGDPAGIVSDLDLVVGEWLGTDSERLSTMAAMTAGELMSKPVLSVPSTSALEDAIEVMRDRHAAHLVVLEGGRPAGMLSISDLVSALGAGLPQGRHVRDVMSWGFLACRAGTPARSVARVMADRRSRSALVFDGDGRLEGVVTGFDLIPELVSHEGDAGSRAIEHFAHAPVTIKPDASLEAAADLMLSREIHRLVVVDGDPSSRMPLGIISTTDIATAMGARGSGWR